jgi:hypothetical protein
MACASANDIHSPRLLPQVHWRRGTPRTYQARWLRSIRLGHHCMNHRLGPTAMIDVRLLGHTISSGRFLTALSALVLPDVSKVRFTFLAKLTVSSSACSNVKCCIVSAVRSSVGDDSPQYRSVRTVQREICNSSYMVPTFEKQSGTSHLLRIHAGECCVGQITRE